LLVLWQLENAISFPFSDENGCFSWFSDRSKASKNGFEVLPTTLIEALIYTDNHGVFFSANLVDCCFTRVQKHAFVVVVDVCCF
jgi:hypothetical protein